MDKALDICAQNNASLLVLGDLTDAFSLITKLRKSDKWPSVKHLKNVGKSLTFGHIDLPDLIPSPVTSSLLISKLYNHTIILSHKVLF